jgi:2-polyprenyl-3-methyl-5-hydroxy-6-metoxy-1,4-benzoquinol methylase
MCKCKESKIFETIESFGFSVKYYQCKKCRLIFQSENESVASNPEFYEKTYRNVYQSSEEPTPKDLFLQEQRANFQVKTLRQNGIVDIQSVLDIGASSGILLETFRDAFKARVIGIEPGKSYRSFAEEKGLKIFASIDELIQARSERFDLVSMMHVLEHLKNPLEELIKIREILLGEKGILLLEVPNFYAHDGYELAHLTCYTPHLLREMVNLAGFRIIKENQHGYPRSKVLNLYINILATPQNEVKTSRKLRPEKSIKIKRNFCMFYRKIIQKLFPKLAWLPIQAETN